MQVAWQATAHNVHEVSTLMTRLNPNLQDVKDGGATALHKAVKGEAQIVFQYRGRQAEFDAKQEGERNRRETVEKLVFQIGADVDLQTTSSGSTALHLAAWADDESLAVMMTLLSAQARVDIRDNNGMSALHIAAGNSAFAAVQQLLMSAQIQGCLAQVINAPTLVRQLTPLHMVCRGAPKSACRLAALCSMLMSPLADGCTRTECCVVLLEHDADPSIVGTMGETVLHTAARWGDRVLCEVCHCKILIRSLCCM